MPLNERRSAFLPMEATLFVALASIDRTKWLLEGCLDRLIDS